MPPPATRSVLDQAQYSPLLQAFLPRSQLLPAGRFPRPRSLKASRALLYKTLRAPR
jgi:hypothetical protein